MAIAVTDYNWAIAPLTLHDYPTSSTPSSEAGGGNTTVSSLDLNPGTPLEMVTASGRRVVLRMLVSVF